MKVNELKVGSILSILTIIVGSLVQIFYTPFYMKHLGTIDYGINSLVQSIMGYMGMLNLGLGNAMLRYTVRYRAENKIEEEKRLNGMFLLIFTFLMILSCLIGIYIYINIPIFFKEKFTIEELIKTRKVFLIMALNIAISFPAGVFGININSREKFMFQRGIKLVTIVLNPVIGAILMLNGFGLIAVTISTVFFAIITYIFDILYALKLGMEFKFKNFDWTILKEIAVYSSFIFLNIVIDRLYWGTDRIIIGKYVGVEAIAIYSIASIFNTLYMGFSTAISGVLFPKINRLVVENRKKELSDLFIKIGRLQYILLGLISSGFILFGKDFIYLWLGKGYGEVYRIALWIMIPLTIPLIQNTGISIMQAKNMHQFRSVIYFFVAILNIIVSVMLVKNYGAIGCAIATGISFIIGNIVIINIYYQKKVGLDMILFWKNILKMSIPIFVAMTIGYSLNIYLENITIFNFIFKIKIYCLVYMILLYKFALNVYEKGQINSFLFKAKNKIRNVIE